MPLDTTAPPSQLGNYEIVSKIAEGGMGTVYKAKNRSTGEIVALKVIAPATAKNPVLLQRFEREFVAAKVLNHPNVVKAVEYCGAMPHPFIVMEFVDGMSIGQRIEAKGAYTEAEAIRLIKQVCDGLQGAHKQGLVHRDVKPDNILVTRDGVAKLTDMGLVKDLEGDLNLTRTGRGLGTPHYMAPEQFRNAKSVDVRGDIYSLGATLYAMVTGVIPFGNASPLDCWMKKIRNEFSSPKELNAALSDRIDWAIRRAMSAEPSQRPGSCREFVEDLTGQSRAVTTPAPTPAAPQAATDVWYLVYRDENNQPHTVKGSTDGIRKALRERLLGDSTGILVSRTKNGQFVPLSNTPEFRDLVVTPTPMPLPNARMGDPNETSDYGSAPPPAPGSGVHRGRPTPPSGRYPAPPPPSPSAPISSPRNRVAAPPPVGEDLPPEDGTAPYDYNKHPPVPVSQPTPTPNNRERRERDRDRDDRDRERRKKKPFDWTPVLVLLVMVLSGVIGYLLFFKK